MFYSYIPLRFDYLFLVYFLLARVFCNQKSMRHLIFLTQCVMHFMKNGDPPYRYSDLVWKYIRMRYGHELLVDGQIVEWVKPMVINYFSSVIKLYLFQLWNILIISCMKNKPTFLALFNVLNFITVIFIE